MRIEQSEIIGVLASFNPWWRGDRFSDLATWRRAVFAEFYHWVTNPPTHRAVLISGARQIGKTTLLMQAIEKLIQDGVSAGNILYATCDHPVIKLAGIEAVLSAWREREPQQEGPEYIFLDEAQFLKDWGTWIKHQVDFHKHRRVIFTGSASPLLEANQESGVGRWHTIRLTTLSFYEYLQIKKLRLPALPSLSSLKSLFVWEKRDIYETKELALPYIAHFHEYLVRGGFPQSALMATIPQAQRLLREDIVDKVLKRDMTALFGVRRVLDLEYLFLYLCRHDGSVIDMNALCSNLEIKRPTAQHFISLLEAAHLIYRLSPFGYGKEILRGRYKIYLADAAIAPAVMLTGRSILDDPVALGVAAEAAVLRHLFMRYYSQNVRFSYWRGKKGSKELEVDLVAELDGQIVPFEVKYRNQHTSFADLRGLPFFCEQRRTDRGYVVTKSLDDFGLLPQSVEGAVPLFKLPAVLLCYWMGEMEMAIGPTGIEHHSFTPAIP
jgi:predicted AAA+ superfamily ATPase